MLAIVTVAALVAVTVADRDSGKYSLIPSRTRFSQQCAGYCKASTKYSLRPGETYVYYYEGTTATEVAGASNDSSQINITAMAHIQVLDSECDLLLQLRNVELYDSGAEGLVKAERQKEFAATLQASPLRFSLQDGRIDQLCPSADESIWALNLKRGLLSAFQNSMVDMSKGAHLYERDVSGSCETSYTVTVRPFTGSWVKVLRRKDLQSCSGRGHQTLGLATAVADKPKSVPIVKSEQYCEQTIKEGVYLSDAKCTETHLLAPFSNGQSGIKTTSTLSLSLKAQLDSEPIPSELFVNTRTGLQFDFSSSSAEQTTVEEDVWNTLKQLAAGSSEGVGRDVPQLFNQLVSQLSTLDDQQLVKMFDEVREQRLRQFLMDGLPLVGSAASVSAMYQIYRAQQISGDELDSWLTALAFHKQPTLDLIRTLNVFVQEDFHPKAWLAVSAVVHAYCRQDFACADKPEVQQLMTQVEQVLGESCHTSTTEQQERVVVALKAVGNAGFTTSTATLQRCYSSNRNPIDVRLAAVAATRRFSCSKMHQLAMLQVFQDHRQDSELRTAAYLAALQCPSTALLSQIRDTLYQESINQVLSFVWTHLTNLQESTSSWRKELRELLQDSHLANKFRTDVRKFSRNYESSFYSDILNSGATVDSNIIFSIKSYLPRSATLNLTLDLFGESVNIFEVGTRMEGFESTVENLFSKKGLFPDESMEKMLYNMRNTNDETNEVIQTFSDQFTKDIVNQPQGIMYARIFGNELYLTQFNSLSKFVDQKVSGKNSVKYLLDSLSSLFTNKKVDYVKSFRFLNSKYVMPTILGLPLRLEVNGTATLGIGLSTEVDLNNILKTKSGNVALSCNPSTMVQIDGKMIVDAHFTQAGVETKGSLSSNTYLDTKITVDKGQVIDISVNVPREKVEVVNVTSAVYTRRREGLVEIEGVGEVMKHNTCAGKYVPTVSGMRVCSQMEVRNASAVEDAPYFPLTGRFQYALGLYKSDDFRSYQLHLKQMFVSTNGRYSGKFLLVMDTPGSSMDRRLLADVGFDSGNGDARLELASPVGSMVVTGKLEERSVDVRAQVGGQDYAAVRLALQTDSSTKAIRYEPSLLLQAQPDVNINLTGSLNIVPGNKYNVALSASGLTTTPITFSGDFSAGKGHYACALMAKAESVDVKVTGKLVSSPSTLSCKAQVRYVLRPNTVQGLDFAAKIQNYRKGSFHKKHLWINLQMTELPEYSTKATWILYHTQRYFDSNFDVTFGKSQWKGQQLYHNNMVDKNKNFEIILSLESPTKNLDYRAEVQYKTTDDTIHSHALAQLSKQKQFISRLDYTVAHPQHRLELEAATPWEIASLEVVLDFRPPSDATWDQEVKGVVFLKWGDFVTPRWISASGVYKAAEALLSARHGVDVSVERKEWQKPLQLKGEWFAVSNDGIIFSNMWLTLSQLETYKLEVDYSKISSLGKQDLSARLMLPENSYSSEFVLMNRPELKNVTIRLDLEKSIYFTSQLDMWKAFDLQLFWNYLEDASESVVVKYESSVQSEVAVISMPGHYALLTVEKLGPGFSSMNVTALWGEAEDSANNAVLLSTFWLLDTTPWYAEQFWLPTVCTRVHLITPFLGFERQSFSLNMNGSADNYPPLGTITRQIEISTKWQDQFVNFEHHHVQKYSESKDSPAFYGENNLDTTFTALVTSSLKALKEGKINIKLHDKKYIAHSNLENIEIDASYNDEVEFFFNSSCLAQLLKISSHLKNRTENNVFFSTDLSISKKSIELQSVLPSHEKVIFTSNYDWPTRFSANLSTPFVGYEESAARFDISIDRYTANANLYGNLNTDYFQILANFDKSSNGFNGKMNLSSTSPLPDITVMVEHNLLQSQDDFYLKDMASVVLSKRGKPLQTGQVFLSFADDQRPLVPVKTKQLQTILQFPGHYSSSNYSYQSVIKVSGAEIQHVAMHSWNRDKTDVTLTYQGLSTITAVFNRNDNDKAEFLFRNYGNGNIRTDISLNRKYLMKHRFYFVNYQSWENFLMVSSPSQKVIAKNLQTSDAEETNFVHKSTISLDEEVVQLDFVVNLDKNTKKLENFIFSTTTPWSHPLVAKYDLIVDTGATKKHELELKLKDGIEIKLYLDTTVTESKYSASFNLHSPYCKNFEGAATYEFSEVNAMGNAILKLNGKQLSAEVELTKSNSTPSFKMSLTNSIENIMHLSCNYNISTKRKRALFIASYFGQEITFQSHCSVEDGSIKTGFMLNTPFSGWEEVAVDLDSVLSRKYSMFVLSFIKAEKFLILSGTGTFQSDLLKSSLSIDYFLAGEPQKHSAVLELSRGMESLAVLLNYMNNEVSIIEFDVKYIKEIMSDNGQISYTFFYKAHLPFENFPDTSFDVKSVGNNKKQIIMGKVNVDSWESSIKGENTFDEDGSGYLSLKIISPGNKAEVYLKRVLRYVKDSYVWKIEKNNSFLKGAIAILSTDENLQAQFGIESSLKELSNINGDIKIKRTLDSFIFETLSMVNDKNCTLKYVITSKNDLNSKTEHDLLISVPLKRFENIRGSLIYVWNNSHLSQLKGKLTDGVTEHKMSYHSDSENYLNNWYLNIDLPNMFSLTSQRKEESMELTAKTTSSSTFPKFVLNTILNKTRFHFEIDGDIEKNVKLNAALLDSKLAISVVIGDLIAGAVFELDKHSLVAEFSSNIQNWKEMGILAKHKTTNKINEKYTLSVSKNKEELVYLTVEGTCSKFKGENLVTVTMPQFVMDLNINYDLSSNFSVDLAYNINGNKQQAQGKLSFLPESTRIDLATPIKGFEDLTLIGTLNRKNKKIGLALYNGGKHFDIEVSSTVEKNLVTLKGTVNSENTEFILTIGGRNGTSEDPSAMSVYINTLKNKQSVFWLSLEGSNNIEKKAGIKLSFSSQFYKQVYLEIYSHKEEEAHTLLFHYFYGIDVVYMLKTVLAGNIYSPSLVINSHFNSKTHYFEATYDFKSSKKVVSMDFKQNSNQFVKLVGEASLSSLSSSFKLELENSDILNNIENVLLAGEYNFQEEICMNIYLKVNYVKYFQLALASSSLSEVTFYSFLLPSNHTNNYYDVALFYNFFSPSPNIFSKINVSGEYYLTNASLTWDETAAEIFFDLKTNAGYGFKNVTLLANYLQDEELKRSHLFDLSIDEATLFHTALNISYPNEFSVGIILPDSFFLPLAKEIQVFYNNSKEEKTASFKYLSGWNENKLIDCYATIKKDMYKVELYRSEINNESNIKVDNFTVSYNNYYSSLDFKTLLVLDNRPLLSLYYSKGLPSLRQQVPLSTTGILQNEIYHLLNITAGHDKSFEFSGEINPTNLLMKVQIPSTPFLNTGLSELELNSTIGPKEFIKVYFNKDVSTELSVVNADFRYSMISSLLSEVNSDQRTSNLKLVYNNRAVSLHHEYVSESISRLRRCQRSNSFINIVGLTEKPIVLNSKFDREQVEVHNDLQVNGESYSFGGKIREKLGFFLCSSINVYFNSSTQPEKPFAIVYQTNCQDNLFASFNLFDRVASKVHADIEYNEEKVSGFKFQSTSSPWAKELSVTGKLLDNMANLDVSLNKDVVHVELHYSKSNHSIMVESSYDVLKSAEISNSMNDLKGKYFGKFKIKGSKASTEWAYSLSHSNNGSMVCHITSDKAIELEIEFKTGSKLEMLVKLKRAGKHHEGKGTMTYFSSVSKVLADSVFSVDGKEYAINFERYFSTKDHNASIKLKTPTNEYYVVSSINKGADLKTPFFTLKYKTPFHPLDYADFKVRFSKDFLKNQEHLSLKGLGTMTEVWENYVSKYHEILLDVSLKTNTIDIDNARFTFTYGNRYGASFSGMSKKVDVAAYILQNNRSFAFLSLFDMQGFETKHLQSLMGKSSLTFHLNYLTNNAFASLEIPFTKKILLYTKCTESLEYSSYYSDKNRTSELKFGENSILKLVSHKNTNKVYEGRLDGNWKEDNILKFNFKITKTDVYLKINVIKDKQNVVTSEFWSIFEETNNTQIKTIKLHVHKLFSIHPFYPLVVIKRELSDDTWFNLNLNFTNGFTFKDQTLSGSFYLNVPSWTFPSYGLNPPIYANASLLTYSKMYEVNTELSVQDNMADSVTRWRKVLLSRSDTEDTDFTSLRFGGDVTDNKINVYLDENKLSGFIENSDNKTYVFGQFLNEKDDKNMTIVANVLVSPIYILTISHSFFESPCAITVKVDKQPLSVESAVTVVYNNEQQDAFVNIYLDSNPQYIELTYQDIWQQTHEASVHFEKKDNEVTIRAKINSPAMDENFLIVTIGNSNDKFDLNLNDAFIFKAFKDEVSGFLDLFLSESNYKLQYKCESQVEIKVDSPKVNGIVRFSFVEINNIFLESTFDIDGYQFALIFTKNNYLTSLKKGSSSIFDSYIKINREAKDFQVDIQCNILNHVNKLTVKRQHDPILIEVTLTSPYYLKNNLEIILEIENKDVLKGNLEVRQTDVLFKSFLYLMKPNKTIEINIEAPLFTEMDRAKLNGVFNNCGNGGSCEVRFSVVLETKDSQIAQSSLYLVKNDDVFTSGLVVKTSLKTYENMEVSIRLPLQMTRDITANLIVQLPNPHLYQISFVFCNSDNSAILSAVAKWQDLVLSAESKRVDSPFYFDMFEWNFQYLKTKLQIGAWMQPKYPLTDYIYFVDLNEKRVIEVSHALVLEHNHFKSKAIVETAFKGHEKYGVDLELQNLKVGKVIKVLGSAPQFGKDLGIDFGFSYESLLNYAVLGKIRIPHNNKIKTAQFISMQLINPKFDFIKMNHSLDFSELGTYGLELKYIYQVDSVSLESLLKLNSIIYFLKSDSSIGSDKSNLELNLETPFELVRNGAVHFSGTKGVIGSELTLSLNSNEIVNINITKDVSNTKEIFVLSKWRSVSMRYLFEAKSNVELIGYLCWDMSNKNISQLGLSITQENYNQKQEITAELILPSMLIPKLGLKAALKKVKDEFFCLAKVDFPELIIEGKLAKESVLDTVQSGVQVKWTKPHGTSKNIGLFHVSENSEEEIKHHFTLQHFSLVNDITLSLYNKNTLYGAHLQYSPLKEEEVTAEFVHWYVEDDDGTERTGVKLTLLHPASNTLIYSVANLTSTTEYTQSGMSVAYLASQTSGIIKSIEVYGRKSKKSPEVFVVLASNGNSLGVGGSVWRKENHLRGVTLEALINQKDPLRLEVVQNTLNPGIEAEFSYSSSRRYVVSAGIPNSNEITAKLTHSMYGKQSLDAFASIRLNTSRILWGRIELPPISHVAHEFCSSVMEEYADASLVSQAVVNGFNEFFEEDFSNKIVTLSDAVTTTCNKLIQETTTETEVIVHAVQSMRNIATRLYEDDHFHLKTFYQQVKKFGEVIYKHGSCAVDLVADIVSGLFRPLTEMTKRVWGVVQPVLSQWRAFVVQSMVGGESSVRGVRDLLSGYQSLRSSLRQYSRQAVSLARAQLALVEQTTGRVLAQAELLANQLTRRIERELSLQLQRVLDYKDTMLAGLSVLQNTVQEMFEIVTDGIYRIKEVRHGISLAVKYFDSINNWFTDFQVEPYFRSMESYINKIFKLVLLDFEKNFGEYEVYLVKANTIMEGHYEELNKIPQVQYIRTASNIVYQKVKWFWNYADLSAKLRTMVTKYVSELSQKLDTLENHLDSGEQRLKTEYNFVPENNSLTFTQELPFEWRSFYEMPRYKMDFNTKSLYISTHEYSNMVQTTVNHLWQDAKLLPYMLPPFGAQAVISRRNFITFDNSYFSFIGNCNSYLLAADLYQNTFSLVANYDQQGKRSLILTNQGVEILVKNNLEVYTDGELLELPNTITKQKSITFERKVHSVMISSEDGVSLECSSFPDLCTLRLSVRYLGKTAGLLGTYNNEPSDDFSNAKREMPETLEEFTRAWAVDTRGCEVEESTSTEDAKPDESMCELFFSWQSSPFYPCFHVVDPKPFWNMCLKGERNKITCSSFMAYISKCTMAGVQLWMPEFCVDTSIIDSNLTAGYTDVVEVQSQMSADVVFVVEEAECVKSDLLNLGVLATNLNSDLRQKGLEGNKFAFLSFRSEHADIHTLGGDIWTSDEALLAQAVSRLRKHTETGPAAYNSALDLAAGLFLRPAVAKVVVLVHCSSCSFSENYANTLERFKQNDITLHILQKENLMGKKSKVVSKAIGLEKSGAYPRKRLNKNVMPSSQLLQQVSVPQDMCTPIMMSTNGSLFNIDVTRKSLSMWSERVAEGAVPTTAWQQCERVLGQDNVPTWHCHAAAQDGKLKDWDQMALEEYMDSSRVAEFYTEYEDSEP